MSPETKKLALNTNKVTFSGQEILFVNPLNDHDYTHKNNSLLLLYKLKPKNNIDTLIKKPTVKITNIKAVFNCKICGFTTMNKDVIGKHMNLHERIRSGKYVACGRCTVNKTGYEKCPKCSYFSKSKLSLKKHMKIHVNGTPYKCIECPFSGKDLKELIRHYSEVKNVSCEGCSYVTHVKEKLLRHKQNHDKLLICEICGVSYVKLYNLDRHYLKCHPSKHG